jgi:hypothetical protein
MLSSVFRIRIRPKLYPEKEKINKFHEGLSVEPGASPGDRTSFAGGFKKTYMTVFGKK